MNSGNRSKRGYSLIELLVSIGIIAILSSLTLPAVARAKAKAHRIKCVSNLRQIGFAFRGFADDNKDRMPWQQTPRGLGSNFLDYDSVTDRRQINAQIYHIKTRVIGYNPRNAIPGSTDILSTPPVANVFFSLPIMKRELQTINALHSPCDATRAEAAEFADENWSYYDASRTPDWQFSQPFATNYIPKQAISYVVVRGADVQRPSTILATTRNLSHTGNGALMRSKWVGSDTVSTSTRAMAGLLSSQGNAVLADGSAKQCNDADIGPMGELVDAHENSRGGLSLGPARSDVFGLD